MLRKIMRSQDKEQKAGSCKEGAEDMREKANRVEQGKVTLLKKRKGALGSVPQSKHLGARKQAVVKSERLLPHPQTSHQYFTTGKNGGISSDETPRYS